MPNGTIVLASIEGVTLLLKLIYEFAKQSGLSEEEIEQMYQTTLSSFKNRDPDNLPQV